jgi:secreted trypsin-like serine protease
VKPFTRGRSGGVLLLGVPLLLAFVPAGAAAQQRTPTPAARIVGGTAPNRPWPAQGYLKVALGGNATRICAGTLVSGRWFLTAGHCVTDRADPSIVLVPPSFTVYLGETDTTLFAPSEQFAVDSRERDPQFNRRAGTATHDLAVLHLARATPATPRYEPMRLVSAEEAALWSPGTVATVIGWGASSFGGPVTTQLQQAGVPILDDGACASAYPAADPNPFVATTMFCAGDGTADTCTGDSGGPIMVPRVDTFALAGVTSYGFDCGNAAKPGVYARVGAPGLNSWVRAQIPTAAIAINPTRPEPDTDVALTATATRPPSQIGVPTYRWDFDDDGAYDDAVGANVTLRRVHPGSTVVRVQESYSDDDRALAREVVTTAGSPLPLPPPPPPPPPTPGAAGAGSPPGSAGTPAGPDQASSGVLPALARLLPGPRSMSIRGLLDGRLTIGVRCSAACLLKARFTLDWRTARRLGLTRSTSNVLIGTGQRRLRNPGSVKVTIRLTKRALRALRRTRSGATRVRVTATAGRRTQRLERAIKLHA